VATFLLLRVRAHRLLLAAALLAVVLTTSVPATFAAFDGAVGDAGLRRTLQGPSAVRTLFEVKADVTGRDRAAVDASVRKAATAAYAGLPVRTSASTRSGPYGLPLRLRTAYEARSGNPDLTLLATFDSARVTMAEGTRPGPAPEHGAVPVALPEPAARALRLRTGSRITLTDRLGGPPLRVRLTGIYRPADPTALYWRLDPLGGHGSDPVGFTTYGPLLTDPSVFASGRVAPAAMSWQTHADFSAMTTGRAGALRAALRRAETRIAHGPGGSHARVSTDLPGLLSDVHRSLLVSRATLLIGALQLVVLAGFALLLVARLLAEERAEETALLHARGGSRGRVAALAAGEALLLTVPSAVAAPLLAGPLVRLLAGHGALARSRLRLTGPVDGAAWWAAAATALACALVVCAPALRRSGTHAGQRAARAWRRAVPVAVRAGADVGLLVVAGLAYWQLSRRAAGSGVLTADTGGTLGVDPVLVAAPALCLLAGTVLAVRLLPLAARLGERRAARGRGLALALAGWQLSRRAGRGAGPVLLLVLAIAMGVLAVGQGASWDRSQHDQADFAVGADVRVTGTATPTFGQGGAFAAVPGVAAATPAARTQMTLPQGREATVLAMDTTRASGVLRLRSDQAGRAPRRLLAPLRPAGPRPPGFTLPGGARQVRIAARLTGLGPDGHPVPGGVGDSLTATVEDRYGVPYSFALDELPADGATHVLTLDLAAAAGSDGAPAGPLRLTRLTAAYGVPPRTESHLLVIGSLRAVLADGTVRAVPSAHMAWTARAAVADPDYPGHTYPRAGRLAARAGEVFRVRYETGAVPHATYHPDTGEIVLGGAAAPPAPLTGIATSAFLKAAGTKAGGTADVQLSGTSLTVRIVRVVRSLPTAPGGGTAGDGGAVLVDLRTVDRILDARSAALLEPSEWWLATRPGAASGVAAALRARPDGTTVLARGEQARELSADPLEAGPREALPAAAIAAAVLAAAGFAVATAGGLRERSREFAVLRALGAPRHHIARTIVAEQGLLMLIAVGVGLALGTLLTRLVVPLIVLTGQAARPVPGVLVEIPPGPVLELLAAALAVPLLAVVAMAVRRGNPVPALRQGGE
jgi:FtsX-like permease family